MDNKLVMNLLAAAAIYLIVAALFGAGIKMIATQVPAGRMDQQFAPVVCKLSVACSSTGTLQIGSSFDEGRLWDDR